MSIIIRRVEAVAFAFIFLMIASDILGINVISVVALIRLVYCLSLLGHYGLQGAESIPESGVHCVQFIRISVKLPGIRGRLSPLAEKESTKVLSVLVTESGVQEKVAGCVDCHQQVENVSETQQNVVFGGAGLRVVNRGVDENKS